MTLHIYAQEEWHTAARIVGTHDEMERLHRLIGKVLALSAAHEPGDTAAEGGKDEFSVADGEGYDVVVAVASEETLELMPLPYTNPDAKRK